MNTTIELLTVEDIARLYKVEHHTARDKIIKTPGFPDPAPGSSLRSRRWLASDVHAFVTRKPSAPPQKSRTSGASR